MSKEKKSDLNALERVEDAIGWELNIRIEDGVMKIEPADAGIALFGYITLSQDDSIEYEREIEAAQDTIDSVRDDNAKLRDMLEDVVSHMEDCEPLIADKILRVIYPISATNTDGDAVKFEGETY